MGKQWFLGSPYVPSVLWRTPPNIQWRCQHFHKTIRVPDIICGFQTQQKHKSTNEDWNLQNYYLSKEWTTGGFLPCTCWGTQETAVLVQMRHLGTAMLFSTLLALVGYVESEIYSQFPYWAKETWHSSSVLTLTTWASFLSLSLRLLICKTIILNCRVVHKG